MWNKKMSSVYKGKLPNLYQQVEWIGGDNNSFIATNVIPSQTIKYEVSCQVLSIETYSGNIFLFGNCTGWFSDAMTFYVNTSGIGRLQYGNAEYKYNTLPSFFDRHTYVFDGQNGLYVDGVMYCSFSQGTFYGTGNISFLNGTNLEEASHQKLFYAKIWDNNTIVRNFIPCYRKSDGVIGMYDTVGQQFYTNAGTGTFTKGGNIYV